MTNCFTYNGLLVINYIRALYDVEEKKMVTSQKDKRTL